MCLYACTENPYKSCHVFTPLAFFLARYIDCLLIYHFFVIVSQHD